MAISTRSPRPRSATSGMVWRFARATRACRRALLALLVAAAATLAIPYAFKLIIDRGFGKRAAAAISPLVRISAVMVVVLALATAVRFYFVSWLGERTVADIRLAVHRNLLRLAPGFFEENRPAEITSRITVDTTIIEQVVGTTVSVALRNIVMGIGGIVYPVRAGAQARRRCCCSASRSSSCRSPLGRRVRNVSRRSQDRIADVGTITSEVLGAMKIVQAFGQEERESEPLPRRGRARVRDRQAPHHCCAR
jgi:ATP-binding cassette subfamily B protein